MEEIIKALNWPHFTFLFALIFLFIYKKQIETFMSRIASIDKNGIKISPMPEAQREKDKTEAVQELLLVIGDSIVLRDIEGRIKTDLESRGLETNGDTIKVLIKHLGATKVLLDFEQIHNLIFGSQIYLLKRLNEVIGQGLSREDINVHFNRIQEKYNEDFIDWSVDQYMTFLLGRSLVTVDNDTYHITNLGVEYLTWIMRNGRSENMPL
ncbi:hypothetical protein [Sulfuricurvum sp. RIFCSPLOWO2_12_FULL_43_24]|uniref:hypothetical protein n=1 Tax=Sulfuricurvum sp. RIFCSPLOWO2_12_FULL_43_24 TaxID=1802247 RepID=UPI0008C7232A|nr:hypothetical protein [Sulfuricurvum sp. RIFCSPLOWO2_12_FULL_43_24]OHD90060.1 MAG: hypothetical protein A3G19_11125 [Sulfuricurvum sp. RIFCSPLOWO2_12_FULL_43_24]